MIGSSRVWACLRAGLIIAGLPSHWRNPTQPFAQLRNFISHTNVYSGLQIRGKGFICLLVFFLLFSFGTKTQVVRNSTFGCMACHSAGIPENMERILNKIFSHADRHETHFSPCSQFKHSQHKSKWITMLLLYVQCIVIYQYIITK